MTFGKRWCLRKNAKAFAKRIKKNWVHKTHDRGAVRINEQLHGNYMFLFFTYNDHEWGMNYSWIVFNHESSRISTNNNSTQEVQRHRVFYTFSHEFSNCRIIWCSPILKFSNSGLLFLLTNCRIVELFGDHQFSNSLIRDFYFFSRIVELSNYLVLTNSLITSLRSVGLRQISLIWDFYLFSRNVIPKQKSASSWTQSWKSLSTSPCVKSANTTTWNSLNSMI